MDRQQPIQNDELLNQLIDSMTLSLIPMLGKELINDIVETDHGDKYRPSGCSVSRVI